MRREGRPLRVRNQQANLSPLLSRADPCPKRDQKGVVRRRRERRLERRCQQQWGNGVGGSGACKPSSVATTADLQDDIAPAAPQGCCRFK